MKDSKRMMLDEFKAIADSNEYDFITALKSEVKEPFSDKISGELELKKRNFDYAVAKMLQSHGYRDTEIRDKFDKLYIELNTERILKYKPNSGTLFASIFSQFNSARAIKDDFSLKRKMWYRYIQGCEKIFKSTIDV